MAESMTGGTLPAQASDADRSRVLGFRFRDLALMATGVGLLAFLGWGWNSVFAAWFVPVFLIRFFRSQKRWFAPLIAVPLMMAIFYQGMSGSWELTVGFLLSVSFARTLPFLAALYMDRFFSRRVDGVLATLVYPSTYVLADYVFSFGPVGSIFSAGATQYSFSPFVQLTAVTGLWGLSFVTGWFGATVNALLENGFDAKRVKRPIVIFAAVAGGLIAMGSLRLAVFRTDVPTVRIGSIAVPHPNNYWDEIDVNTPRNGAVRYAAEFADIENQLFLASERAVASGAKIVMWSEGNAVMYEDHESRFMERANRFAQENGVYLAPGMLVLHYGTDYAQNKVPLIGPDGEIVFSYEKTKTPFPTESDGVLPVADTPYGRLSAAVCFDMDFPTFANQLGSQDVDIMLVPSFDTKAIAPFHTETALFRAVENGFSLVRQVNKGASMAVDAHGNVLAYQDFFGVDDATMISDVPVRGVTTLYGIAGDWFVYACALFLLVMLGSTIRAPRPA